MTPETLDAYLTAFCTHEPSSRAVADAVAALAAAAVEASALVGAGSLDALLDDEGEKARAEPRLVLELEAAVDDLFIGAARDCGAGAYLSTPLGAPVALGTASGLAIAVDPLGHVAGDAMSPLAGSIFSILPPSDEHPAAMGHAFRQPGSRQLAAGMVLYGPQLTLVLTLRDGTHAFAYSSALGAFVRARKPIVMPPRGGALAIDMVGHRHWGEGLRAYVDDCFKGAAGPHEHDFFPRWSGSLVADAFHVLHRGGAFVSTADDRKGHAHGRLRMVCQANPLAVLAVEAGGSATDGIEPLLERPVTAVEQKTPLVFGSKKEVDRIRRYLDEPSVLAERAPLFGHRGLFRS